MRARTETPYGKVAVSWTRGDGAYALAVAVPTGSSAEVRMPNLGHDLGLDRHEVPEGAVRLGTRAYEVPAGQWAFRAGR